MDHARAFQLGIMCKNRHTPQEVPAFARQAEAFVGDIALGRKPLASGGDSLDDIRLIEAIWKLEIRERCR